MTPSHRSGAVPGLVIRRAREDDLDALIAFFAADALGGHGDTTDEAARDDYLCAFRAIAASPATRLYVAEQAGRVVGTFELILAHALSGRGALRAIIEAVQVSPGARGRGIGEAMVRHAMAEARQAGAATLALTSNRMRADAHRFYARLGFSPSHLGFKITL